jgi:hypothetical protein
LTLQGKFSVLDFKPMNEPIRIRGAEQHNHSKMREKIVPIGTAAEDPFIHNKISLKKNTMKQRIGKNVHVNKEFLSH